MSWRRFGRIIRRRGSLRSLARWQFLATLAIAPWLYGGTTAWSINLITGLLGLTLTLWVASLLVDRRWPPIPWPLLVICGLVLAQGWWMTANAHAIYDATFRMFTPVQSLSPRLPGSVDYILSFAWMLRATALLGVVCLTADMAYRPTWLLRLWYTIAFAGGAIGFLGLIQKATGAHMIFWQAPTSLGIETFFATYFYHANAGAFLNLVLPVSVGLALWTTARWPRSFMRAAAISVTAVIAVAIVANTSRMAQVVALLLALPILAAIAKPALKMMERAEKRRLFLSALLVVLTLAAVAQAVRLDRPLMRWKEFSKEMPADQRWVADEVAINAVPDAGWFGFGPGTFQAVFPHYQQVSGNRPFGTWRFLHEDYLQTILEWGWSGSVLIGTLFFGGIGLALRGYFRAQNWSNRERLFLPCAVLALFGASIHALVDFPFQILSLQIVVATYVGICWGSLNWKAERRR
jgi:hypothetical protein